MVTFPVCDQVVSPEGRREGLKNYFLAGDGEAIVVVEPELLLSRLEEALELSSGQEGDGDDVSGPIGPHIDNEVAPGDV